MKQPTQHIQNQREASFAGENKRYTLAELWPSEVVECFKPLRCSRCNEWGGIGRGAGRCAKDGHSCRHNTECAFGYGRTYPVQIPGKPKAICFMTDSEIEAHYRRLGFKDLDSFLAEVEQVAKAERSAMATNGGGSSLPGKVA